MGSRSGGASRAGRIPASEAHQQALYNARNNLPLRDLPTSALMSARAQIARQQTIVVRFGERGERTRRVEAGRNERESIRRIDDEVTRRALERRNYGQ